MTSILAQGPAQVKVDDGWLDVTIVQTTKPQWAIAVFHELLQSAIRNIPARHDDILVLRAKWLRVVTTPPQRVVVDGELLEPNALGLTPFEVRCLPRQLTVFVPCD